MFEERNHTTGTGGDCRNMGEHLHGMDTDIPVRVLTPRLPAIARLVFGSLTVGPLQANLPVERAGEVLAYGFDKGINFVDTAQYYRNYAHIRAGLERCREPDKVMISTKTYAYDRQGAWEAVEEARRELQRDTIDLFMLHEQESIHTLHGHREALETLFTLREKGIIRAVGISTHYVAGVEGAISLAAEGLPLDVVHPLFNMAGIGIADGTPGEMAAALERLHHMGCGIFGMKALAGGHLFRDPAAAFSFVLSKPFMDAVAVGMQDEREVDANLAYFVAMEKWLAAGKCTDMLPAFPVADRPEKKRVLHVEEYCEGCGNCVKRCGQNAISLVPKVDTVENPYDFSDAFADAAGVRQHEAKESLTAQVDPEKCVLCGYCTAVCPVFALKVY